MKLRKGIILATVCLSIFLILFFLLMNKANSPNPSVKVGYSLWQGHLPLWIAYEKGFLKEEGINVELIDVGTNYQELIDGVLSKRIDIGLGTFFQTMNIEAKNPGIISAFHLIGETQKQKGISSAIVVSKDKNITSIYDLEGKKIGTSDYFDTINLKTILKNLGINADVIENIDRKMILSALASNKIDAFYSTHPDTIANAVKNLNAKLLEVNVRAKYFGDPYWRTSSIALTEFIKNNPEKLKKYMRAIDKAISIIEEDKNREIIGPILIKYMSTLNTDSIKKIGIEKFAKSTDLIDMKQLNNTVNILVEDSILNQKINVDSFYLSYNEIP